MSKAICEIEKPKCCKECVWYQADAWFGGVCVISKDENGWSKDIRADEEYDVQTWCPLLPKTEAIPVEFLKKLAQKAIGFSASGNDSVSVKNGMLEVVSGYLFAQTIETIVEEWRKENAL